MASLYSMLKHIKDPDGKLVLLNDEDVKHIQRRLLPILDDIVSVCDKNGIRYQLSGGTALGAVRHKGYIPWDDDIDINMERTELERFIPLFIEEYSDKYWILVPGQTPGYDFAMVHILAKDIRARGIMHTKKLQSGLGIDIFIIENVFNNKILRKLQEVGSLGFRYVLSCLRIRDNISELEMISQSNQGLMTYLRRRNNLAKVLSVIPPKVWIKMSNKWAGICKDTDSYLVSIPAGLGMFTKEQYVRKRFCDTVKAEFEGRNLSISADYDDYLKTLYGDYMKIPPPEKRERHAMMELDRDALYNWQ